MNETNESITKINDDSLDLTSCVNLCNKEHYILSNICNIYSQLTYAISPSISSPFQPKHNKPSVEVFNLQIDLQSECRKLRSVHQKISSVVTSLISSNDYMESVLKEHLNLSKRVIYTCTKDCKVDIYYVMSNGGSVSQDMKIVALTSLQASIRK